MADREHCSHGVGRVFGNSNTSFLMCLSSGEFPLHSSSSKHCKEAHCHRAHIQKILAQIQRCKRRGLGRLGGFSGNALLFHSLPGIDLYFPKLKVTLGWFAIRHTRGTLITVTAAFSNGLLTRCLCNLSTSSGEFPSIVTQCRPNHICKVLANTLTNAGSIFDS